jgi:amino acid transporter
VTGNGRAATLRKELRASQFFNLSLGATIGVGWIVVAGSWLGSAGPVGAAIAFVAGGLVMGLVGLCYAEMAATLPVSGAEVAYAFEAFGVRSAYAVGWALALMYTSAVAYVCISMGWILDVLIPGIQGPGLYVFRGETVHAGSLSIGLMGTLSLTWLIYRGIRSAASFQDFVTYAKIAMALVFIGAGVFGGSTANLHPYFRVSASGAIWPGIVTVFISTPWWLGGFNITAQVMEERSESTSIRTIVRLMVLSILLAALFYALVVLSMSMASPWERLATADLAAATAFRDAFHSEWLARMVLVVALLGCATVGNGCFLAATRVLFALSRARMIPPVFAGVHPAYGSPARAVLFVGTLATCGVFFGRSGVLPVINIGSACLALGYVITSLGVIRLRRTQPDRPRPYRVPGGVPTAVVASAATLYLLVMSIYQPYADAKGSLPLEWVVLLTWITLGAVLWVAGRRQRGTLPNEARRRIVLGEAGDDAAD